MSDPDDKFQISIAQVAASSLAAVSAAVICSFFGVAGTVIGTAVASLFATVGSALYTFSLRRTKARLRQLHRAGAASPPLAEVWKTMRQQGRYLLDRVQWASIAIGTGAVFVFSIGVISVIEDTTNLNGAPLSAHRHHHKQPTPVPTVTITETPTASITPTATPTPTKSVVSSPKPTKKPSQPSSPTATPTVTAQPTVTAATVTPEPTATPTPSTQ